MTRFTFCFSTVLGWVVLSVGLLSSASSTWSEEASASASAEPNEAPLRVLFVGNSYTAFFALPKQVAAMCDHAGIDAEIEMETVGGKSWRWHVEEGKAPARIAEGGWDVVVVQEFSRGALDKPDEFDAFGEQIIGLVQDASATPVLYLTWARQHLPDDQATITAKYASLAERTGAEVAPVGEAWRRWLAAHPDTPLYRDDRSHPNRRGTYLAACVMFATITGESPVGQVRMIAGRDVVEKTDTLVDLAADEAEALQRCAWEAVRVFDAAASAEAVDAQTESVVP